jgi:hypothetical protein
MGMSTHARRRFGVLLLMIVATVGCAQFGGENAALPTAPSSLSEGPSARMAGPGVSYDATGSWHAVVIDQRSPDTIAEEFNADLTQDADGTITFLRFGAPQVLTRKGTGLIITYDVSIFVASSPCNFDLSGTARLDTRTNTITARVVGTENDCTKITQLATFTKN